MWWDLKLMNDSLRKNYRHYRIDVREKLNFATNCDKSACCELKLWWYMAWTFEIFLHSFRFFTAKCGYIYKKLNEYFDFLWVAGTSGEGTGDERKWKISIWICILVFESIPTWVKETFWSNAILVSCSVGPD